MDVDAPTLNRWLQDGDELAVLDAREQGVYFRSHLFHAACIPLSQLELVLPGSVPRSDTRVVWCDDGSHDETGSTLAQRAAEKAQELGWSNQHVLVGGIGGWAANGGELYSGVNVPSKAFGEFVEHTYGTPRITAAELNTMIDDGADIVVLDSRPLEEFRNMSIPSGIDCPGAELVHRVKEVVTDPETLVVVNCAGRTRSIIGSQSLINAGLENSVVALENGTMGWELAGFDVVRGHDVHAPDPGATSKEWAMSAVAEVAERFDVGRITIDELEQWQADTTRTTYLFDVRTPAEFEAGHLIGSSNAPGGQLVQATDEYAATRNARLILVDDNGVRATMTASWLRQLGWNDAVVLDVDVRELDVVSGRVERLPVESAPSITVSELGDRLSADGVAVLDVGTSLKYRKKGHIPGSFWGVRSRLNAARAVVGDVETLVITSTDGQLAKLAVPDAQKVWPNASVLALAGGNRAWRHAGNAMESGFERPTTEPDDVWYKPYDHDGQAAPKHMQEYLTWEIALVDQLERDPTVSFTSWA
ncbi:MAG: rhodanese-like domain-containing protein [Ilumatobacter sp.]|nr:rhodanese-like domain-containing protein [Ilumatobacter sp.]